MGWWLRIFAISITLMCGASSGEQRASVPPRGWNSYDSFSWIISEDEFLANAQIMAEKLLPFGYEYAVLDFLWYRKREPGASVGSPGFDVIDEWGRPVPDPKRWPSSVGGAGLKLVAERVHSMGLYFGLHVMRGISTQAVKANTPILGPQGVAYEENGRIWRARDIALVRQTCGWMPKCFMSVNTKVEAGRVFLRSLYQQYADWGVDFVKHDCVFGDDLNVDEISTVSEILRALERPVLYSLSPGTHATPDMAMKISNLVNMYRVTGDDWDTWRDVQSHFDVSRGFASSGLIGAQGLLGKSWPDLDMLPLGWLTDPGVNQGPHRYCSLTQEEQKTQMTLWSMAKSPLMFGGDLRNIDDITMSLITNPTLLAINTYSTNNKEFSQISFVRGNHHHKLEASPKPGSRIEFLLSISSCNIKNTKNWGIRTTNEQMNEVCWNESLAMNKEGICLHYRTQNNASLSIENNRRSRLLESIIGQVCLDSSPNEEFTIGHLKSNHFAPCTSHASQDWELTNDGALKNTYTGLCASVSKVEGLNQIDNARAWIANGLKGEIYIAFFNLGPNTLTISAKTEDVIHTFHTDNDHMRTKNELQAKECSGSEVWSGRDLGVVEDRIVIDVLSHGCALIKLTCT
ncbi:hypothetical protein SUGI_0015090 [Cryptomeria japonica]|nr:hypothetical protein SUGI_0015090 [Cryptomeria japonica]